MSHQALMSLKSFGVHFPTRKPLSVLFSSFLILLLATAGFGFPRGFDSTRNGRSNPAGLASPRESAEAAQQKKRKKKRRRKVFAPGTLFGGIEVGSKGVKAIVVERKKINGEYDFKIHFESSKNTKVIDAKGKGVTDSGVVIIEDTAKATADYFNEIKSRNVKPEHIFIVGSSGIAENLDEAQKVVLVSRIAQFTGRTMEFINVEQEVMFSINGLVSPSSLPTSLLVDVGSGNTKYGYHTVEGEEEEGDTDNLVYGGIKFGTGSFAKEVAKLATSGGDFAAVAKANAAERIRPQLEDEISRKPGLQNRNKVYLSGGIVWAMTTLLHPGEVTLPYSTLSPGDINAFHEMVRKNFNNPTRLFEVDLSGIQAEADRKAAEVEIKRVANAFNIQEMTAGSEILKAVADSFKFEGKKIVVIRSSHVAWIYDYVTVRASES